MARIRWPWYAGLLICLVSQRLAVEASDEDFKIQIITELKKINADLSNINHRMNKLDNIRNDLTLVKGTVESIDSSMFGLEGRSSASHIATTRMETKHKELANQVISLHAKIQSMDTIILRVDDTVGNIEDNLDLVKGIVKVTENHTKSIEGTSSATHTATTNMESKQIKVSNELQILTSKMQDMDSKINNKIQNLKEELGNSIYPNRCPGGFFVSTRCFQAFKNQEDTWAGADEVCRTNGLKLAEPTNDLVKIELLNNLFQRYGKVLFWVNGGNQSKILDSPSSDGEGESVGRGRGPLELHENLTYMHNGQQCLKQIRTGEEYYPTDCTQPGFPLCERYVNSTNQETKLSLMEVFDKLQKIQNSSFGELKERLINVHNPLSTSVNDLQASLNNVQNSQATSVQNIKDYITDVHRPNSTSVNTLTDSGNGLDCPESDGFFLSTGGDQCFKAFTDRQRTWTDAVSKCKLHRMELAKPQDPLGLQSYLNARYGGKGYWLNARGGSGSSYYWGNGGQVLPSNSELWWPGHPGSRTGSSDCLRMTARSISMASNPGRPYRSSGCTYSYYTVCQVVQ